MDSPAYGEPVARLLEIGRPADQAVWPHYPALYGLTDAHVDELARMATDASAFDDEQVERPAVWATVHARRALGQLGASSAGAVDGLVSLLPRVDTHNDDWISEELPEILGMIGPAALPRLTEFLADDRQELWSRVEASKAIKHVGTAHAAARPLCIELLARQLARYDSQPVELNAFLVSWLIDLRAREAADLIERAMRAGRVDHEIVGDWTQVRIDLGLTPAGERPKSGRPWMLDMAVDSVLGSPPPPPPPPE